MSDAAVISLRCGPGPFDSCLLYPSTLTSRSRLEGPLRSAIVDVEGDADPEAIRFLRSAIESGTLLDMDVSLVGTLWTLQVRLSRFEVTSGPTFAARYSLQLLSSGPVVQADERAAAVMIARAVAELREFEENSFLQGATVARRADDDVTVFGIRSPWARSPLRRTATRVEVDAPRERVIELGDK